MSNVVTRRFLQTATRDPRPWAEARALYENRLEAFELPPEHGPWEDEPDEAQWIHEVTGYPCWAKRNNYFGAWCGYVSVPPKHPLHGVSFHEIEDQIDVHGGLTFSDSWLEEGDWWFGFDCGHFMDLQPGMPVLGEFAGGPVLHYRTLKYVAGECEMLAYQLKAVEA